MKKLFVLWMGFLSVISVTAQNRADSLKQVAKQALESRGIAYNEETFIKYVSIGDTAMVKSFLAAGMSPEVKNEEGKTALVIASEKDRKETIRLLVDAGANVEALADVLNKKTKRKDFWDILTALSGLATVIASILIAWIGWYFTQSYNRRQIEQNRIQNEKESAIKEHQNRILEMETIEKMIPHLTKDENSKKVALIAIKSLARSELADQLAQLYPSEGSIKALQHFAASGNQRDKARAMNALSNIAVSGDDQNKAMAIDALDNIFTDFRPAVVRIKGDASVTGFVGTGIIVNKDGYILTVAHVASADKAREKQVLIYSVELSDGTVHQAKLIDTNSTVNLSILKMEAGNYKTITLATNLPLENSRVMAMGAILGGPIKPVIGTVKSVATNFIEVEFDTPGIMPGISGAPVLNSTGETVGISYSFNHPFRQCVRSDIARSYLQKKGISY